MTTDVNTTHRDYRSMVDVWRSMRDHLAGARMVKAAGTRYLPFLGDPHNEDDRANYDRYKQRAMYLSATQRTHVALTGAIGWKEPVIHDLSEKHDERLKDVTRKGESFNTLAMGVVREVIGVSRVGLLVDMPVNDSGVNLGEYPYFVQYATEDILNWRYERVDGRIRLTMVVLREIYERASDSNEFDSDYLTRYRVLRLVDGAYSQQTYEEVTVDDKTTMVEGPIHVPRVRGAVMEDIPFVFITSEGAVPKVPSLLLEGVMEVNTSHYITSADLEHGRHFTALPQPWVAGFDVETELRIGSGTAWVSKHENARAGYLEFHGQGLSSLEKALEHKEKQMAVLGAKLLEGQRPGVVAAETARINQAGESSTLAQVSEAIEAGLTQALQWWTFMQASDDVPTVEMNKDFVDMRLDAAQLTALMQAYIAGGISFETLFWNLQKGEITPADVDLDTEREAIKMEAAQRGEEFNNPPEGE